MTQPLDGVGDEPVVDASAEPAAPSGASSSEASEQRSSDFGAGAAPGTDEADQSRQGNGDTSSEPPTIEGLVESLERVTAERDGYFDSLARLQAEFENYRKAVAKRESDARERANEGLVNELLPVLDACDGAIANGAEDVVPVHNALIGALDRQGLTRLEPTDAPFDPEQHEAVMHEEASDTEGPVVAEVLRVGYQWKGRTLRAAMVRVRG